MQLSRSLARPLSRPLKRNLYSSTAIFTIADLFAASEQGAWYDPSDLTSLYQTNAGSVNAVVGSTVGLALDKRLMGGATAAAFIAAQPELVTNGGFDSTDVSDWSRGFNSVDGTFSVVAGVLTYTVGAGDSGAARIGKAISGLTSGKYYQIQFDEAGSTGSTGSGDRLVVWTSSSAGTGGDSLNQVVSSGWTNETKSYILQATASTMYIFISFVGATTGSTIGVDNISVKEIPGNHGTQATAASRPLLGRNPVGGRRNLLTYTEDLSNAVWIDAANSGATRSNGSVTINAPNSLFYIRQNVTIPAATYTISLEVTCDTTVANVGIREGLVGTAYGLVNFVAGVPQRISWPVTFGSASTNLQFGVDTRTALIPGATASTGFTVTFDDVQLETGSTATAYQKVVTQYDVTEAGVADCYYLAFDGTDDFLVTGNIDFSASDEMSVFAGVRKLSDAASAALVELSATATTNNGSFAVFSPLNPNTYALRSKGTTTAVDATSSATFANPITNTLTGLIDISTDTAILRANGVQVASSASDQGTGNYGNHALYIGRRGGTSLPFNGRLYSLIVRGKLTAGTDLTNTEAYVATQTGVVL